MSQPKACPRCGATLGRYWILDRADPGNIDKGIDLGICSPGPDWWAFVCRWWDVSDRPRKLCWTEPVRCKLVERGKGCTLCMPQKRQGVETPSLFGEE